MARSQKRRKADRKAAPWFSDRAKWSIVISVGTVALVAGAAWAYFTFTTLDPPPLAKTDAAAVEDVVYFLGHPNGLARMPIDAREQYIQRTVANFSGDSRLRFNRALRQMSRTERDTLRGAVTDIARQRLMDQARQYNKTPQSGRSSFVDSAIRDMETMRLQLAGGGSQENLGAAFRGDLPTKSEDWMKLIVTETTPRERAEAGKFFDEAATRYKQLKENPAEMRKLGLGG